MRNQIIELAKKCDADIVGFAPASRFGKDDSIFKIFPNVKTVIGFGYRVLRGIYRGVEEGSTFCQYAKMGVENLEETVMPSALLRVSNLIESEGYIAIPQRVNQLILNDASATNPEVHYADVSYYTDKEFQLDFLNCAVQCGLGERSKIGSLLTEEYGPFVRYCFILTDMELEASPLVSLSLCDGCNECIKACHGRAIKENGEVDKWRCSVYYNGANGSKNPFMPPEAFENFDYEKKMGIINGTLEFNSEEAKEILDNLDFYPPNGHFYRSSICGRACDRACYIHLEQKGVLKKKFNRPFREKEDWKLSTEQFENYGKKSK